jgi:hypothetical protein
LLYGKDIMANRVPSEATYENRKSTMQLKDISLMHAEYSQYPYSKFSGQVSSLRSIIKDRNNRVGEDKQHFVECLKNHPGSAFSHKGYIWWQGSEAQELTKKDIADNLHVTMGKQGMYGLRPAYYDNSSQRLPGQDLSRSTYCKVTSL